MNEKITQREWIALLAMILCIASLTTISIIKKTSNKVDILKNRELLVQDTCLISVYITGAVLKPGLYQVRPGTSFNQLARKAQLSKNADIAKVKKLILYVSQEIEVPCKTKKKPTSKRV